MFSWLKKHKKPVKIILVTIVLLPIFFYSAMFLSFYIQLKTNGNYNLFGPRPRLDIIPSDKKGFDFKIKLGVWDVDTIEFYNENHKELLWKVKFFYHFETEKTEYIKYGQFQKGNMYQLFPSLEISEGFLSYEEQSEVNGLSINGLYPKLLQSGQKIIVKIESYCGHGFEQPNCLEEKTFLFENNTFKNM